MLNRLYLSLILGLTIVLSLACQASSITAPAETGTPLPATVAAAPGGSSTVSANEGNYRVEIAVVGKDGQTAITAAIGTTSTLTIAFRPYKQITTVTRDGAVTKYLTNWSPNMISEMRFCAGLGQTCTLPETWMPFQAEQPVDVPVNWSGLREWNVTAQFRDANRNIIPVGNLLADQASSALSITGVVDNRTPIASQPAAVQTAIAASQAAFPVTGNIQVGTKSPLGGKAGTRIEIPVKFSAASSLAAVTQMRVSSTPMGRCLTPDEMGNIPWQKFTAEKTFSTSIALNWSTFKLHVQYRDEKGNLSTVYCGEVAIEGN